MTKRTATFWVGFGFLGILGTGLLALDGRHYWHDIRFFFAVTQFPLNEVLAGQFNPQQAWGPVDEIASAGFHYAKILHLWLLKHVFAVGSTSLQGLRFAVGASVTLMGLTATGVGVLVSRLAGRRSLGWAALAAFLIMPVTPYLSGKLVAEVTSLCATVWALVVASRPFRSSDSPNTFVQRAVLVGTLLVVAALFRLDSVVGPAAAGIAGIGFAKPGIRRRQITQLVATSALVWVIGYATVAFVLGLPFEPFFRYMAELVNAPPKPIAMSFISLISFGGLTYGFAILSVWSRRRRLIGLFLVWLAFAWLPILLLTANFMVEPRYLVQGAIPLAGLGALGLEAAWKRTKRPRRMWMAASVLLLSFGTNWFIVRTMPNELDRPALVRAVEAIIDRAPDAAILIPWAYTDFNFLYTAFPGSPIYLVNSPTNDSIGEDLKATWGSRYNRWYGDRYLGDVEALSQLQEGRRVFYLGWHTYPPLAFVRGVTESLGMGTLSSALENLPLTDHLETSWVRRLPGVRFRLEGRSGQYEYYRVTWSN